MAKLMNEYDHLESIRQALQEPWESALTARDAAQVALDQITALRMSLTKRQIELQKAQLKSIGTKGT